MKQKFTILFDLDGTLANIDARRDMAVGVNGKMNWDVFFHPSHISFDKPNPQVIKSAQLFKANGFRIFIFSGRNDRSFHATQQWLKTHNVPFDLLVMRPDKFKDESWPVAHGNKATPKMRGMPDEVLKKKMLLEFVGDEWQSEVFCVFDDRQKVVDMWRDLGITCFQVAPGDFK